MRSIDIPSSMIELMFTLPDEQLAEIAMEYPEILNNICAGLSLELYDIEQKSKSNKTISN
jgi:hypothetical protein